MAWKLRQMFEGDTVVTVSNVDLDPAGCWVDATNVYVTNTIAINIDAVEYILPFSSVTFGVGGYATVKVPTGAFIKGGSPVQVYAVCENLPASKSNILPALAVDFQVVNSPIVACNNQTVITSSIKEYIRFFFTDFTGTFFNAKLNGTNMAIADFSYASGDTGNIASSSGNFSRPSTTGASCAIISNTSYTPSNTLLITPPNSTLYFTIRLGYLELVFASGNLGFINYMVASEVEIALGTYVATDAISIESTPTQYIVKKNGTVILTRNKNITYAVTGGTVVPNSSQISTPVAWNLPITVGSYTFTATVGDSLKFTKAVQIHSCANAVNDEYTGTYNLTTSGDVSTNDVKCTGENNYFEQVGAVVGGGVVLNQDGTFVFTPTVNFNSLASFDYRIRCGANFGASEIIDVGTVTINYFHICNGAVASWQVTNVVSCIECVEKRQEIDINAQCTGNVPRWVDNVGGTACNKNANLVATGETRCQSCEEQKEVQDLNPCSVTYQAKTWIANVGGNKCDRAEQWLDNGTLRCENCEEQKQQRDNKLCSPTYNNLRFVPNIGGSQCNREQDLTTLNEFVCLNCEEYEKKVDSNPCSPSFNLIFNVPNPDGEVCTTDEIWVDTGRTRCENNEHKKEQMSTNACSDGTQWIATGLDLCNCIVIVDFTNHCSPNPIVGITTTKQGVAESNRTFSIEGNVFKFYAAPGKFSYVSTVQYQTGMAKTVIHSDYQCNPLI